VCHPENSVVDAPHGLAAADQFIERVAAGDLLGHAPVLDLHGALFQVAVEDDLQFAKVHRRDKKIIHRDLGGLEPQIVIGTAGKRHQGQVLVHAAELGQQVNRSRRRDALGIQIEQHGIEGKFGEQGAPTATRNPAGEPETRARGTALPWAPRYCRQ
jgi:hypothetical protein